MIQQKRYFKFDEDRELKPGKLYRLTASIQGTSQRKTVTFSMMELRFFLVNSSGKLINLPGISACNDKYNDPNCRGLEGKQILDLRNLPSSFSVEATISPTNLKNVHVAFDEYNTSSHLTEPEGTPTCSYTDKMAALIHYMGIYLFMSVTGKIKKRVDTISLGLHLSLIPELQRNL